MGTGLEMNQDARPRLKEPGKYKVVMYNDDFTPMDFVVDILVTVFYKGQEEAVSIMMSIHKGTKAVVGTYPFDIAKTKADRAVSLARQEGYPFRVTVEA